MVLSKMRLASCCMLAFFVPCVYATMITVYNHTRYPVYTALYYVGVNWLNQTVGPITRHGTQICIQPQSFGQVERPTFWPMYYRELFFSVSATELTQTMSLDLYEDMSRYGIGFYFGSVYHIAEMEGVLTCYDPVGWVVERPLVEEAERAIDALVDRLRAQYSNHPYKTLSAQVRTGREISAEERQAIGIRKVIVKAALEHLLHKKIEPAAVYGCGLGFSGGGMRAALSAQGIVEGMTEIGLMDIVSHVAGVSGSTWFLADWMAHGKPIQEYREDLYEVLSTEPEVSTHSITGALWPKYLFGQGLGPVDIFGAYLACRFLRHVPQESDRVHVKFSHLQDRLRDGRWPMPLCSAVEDREDHWITCTPFDVMSEEFDFSVPLWAFGRTFTAGATADFSPELDLGFLMGAWGSAFSGNVEEALKVYEAHINPVLYSKIDRFMQKTGIGKIRPLALCIKNPLYQMQDRPDDIRSEKKLTLMDAGYSSGVPLVPLYMQDRGLKLIFILDVSEDIHQGATELKKAEAYIRSKGRPFPTINYDTILHQPINVFTDPEHPEIPTLVYIVPVNDPRVLVGNNPSTFDPEKEFTTTYKTTHLTYTREACQRLTDFMKSLVVNNKDLLYSVVQNRLSL